MKATASKRKEKLNLAAFIIPMVAISTIHFLIFWVYINFDTVRLTFFEYRPALDEYAWNDFYNYTQIFRNVFMGEDPAARRAFLNTFNALPINIIILPFSIIAAYAFYKKVRGKNIFRVIFYLPSIISIVVLTMAYRAMFQQGTGPVAQFFALFGYTPSWTSALEESKTIWPLIYFYCIMTGLGTNVILMNSAMLRIPNEIVESAELDGCSFFRELISITIPLIMPTITTWVTAILTSVFGFFMANMLIGGADDNGKIMTVPWLIFNAAVGGENNKNALLGGATYGIILSCIVMPVVFIVRWILNKLTPDVSF